MCWGRGGVCTQTGRGRGRGRMQGGGRTAAGDWGGELGSGGVNPGREPLATQHELMQACCDRHWPGGHSSPWVQVALTIDDAPYLGLKSRPRRAGESRLSQILDVLAQHNASGGCGTFLPLALFSLSLSLFSLSLSLSLSSYSLSLSPALSSLSAPLSSRAARKPGFCTRWMTRWLRSRLAAERGGPDWPRAFDWSGPHFVVHTLWSRPRRRSFSCPTRTARGGTRTNAPGACFPNHCVS